MHPGPGTNGLRRLSSHLSSSVGKVVRKELGRKQKENEENEDKKTINSETADPSRCFLLLFIYACAFVLKKTTFCKKRCDLSFAMPTVKTPLENYNQ